MSKMYVVTLTILPSWYRRIKHEAANRGITALQWIREAIKAKLDKENA